MIHNIWLIIYASQCGMVWKFQNEPNVCNLLVVPSFRYEPNCGLFYLFKIRFVEHIGTDGIWLLIWNWKVKVRLHSRITYTWNRLKLIKKIEFYSIFRTESILKLSNPMKIWSHKYENGQNIRNAIKMGLKTVNFTVTRDPESGVW